MARQEIVKTFDDITGEDITDQRGAGSVQFEIDGRRYEIDLSAKNQEELRETLKPFTSAGRRVVSAGVRRNLESPTRRPARVDPQQLQEQRRWWNENWQILGLPEPKGKGRIPDRVVEAYREHDGKKVHKKVDSPFAA